MLLFKIGGEAFGSVRAGHARPLPGGEKGRVSGRGKVRRRGQDPSLRMEDSMAADAKCAGRECPAPTGWLKESSRQQAGIPPALRRHLPLTREAGGGLQYNCIEIRGHHRHLA